ncbi:CLUMA_CG008976, isoform A [Clunio marinus]|uniref:CLUMA_CG008976, isoform A n=1 Tax=Clunio marinus TaxID=568069 RepID=A0A1J1I5P7_9DIPT|nr:CLUMA_CG008976, isoform A [Clunio marinus]
MSNNAILLWAYQLTAVENGIEFNHLRRKSAALRIRISRASFVFKYLPSDVTMRSIKLTTYRLGFLPDQTIGNKLEQNSLTFYFGLTEDKMVIFGGFISSFRAAFESI